MPKARVLPEKPFNVVLAGKRFQFTRDDGWYCVECLDVQGVVTQGRTFEEACHMAASAMHEVEEIRIKIGLDVKPAGRPRRQFVRPSRHGSGKRQRLAEAVNV